MTGEFPRLEEVRIDLTGAIVDPDRPPPDPRSVGNREPAVEVGKLEVAGRPLYIRASAAELELTARNVGFDYARENSGALLLMVRTAADGHVRIRILHRELNKLLFAAAEEAAARQGVKITETDLTLSQLDERSLHVIVRVKAKKLVVKATVRIEGRLTIDDDLVARLSGLSCEGEGVLGSLACGAIRPHLHQVEKRPLPLAAFSLGDVRLHDLRISVGEALEITAKFGTT